MPRLGRTLSLTPPFFPSPSSDQLELLEEKLRELASLPRGGGDTDDRAVALSAVDALRRELALVTRAGLPAVVFGKVSVRAGGWVATLGQRQGERRRSGHERARARARARFSRDAASASRFVCASPRDCLVLPVPAASLPSTPPTLQDVMRDVVTFCEINASPASATTPRGLASPPPSRGADARPLPVPSRVTSPGAAGAWSASSAGGRRSPRSPPRASVWRDSRPGLRSASPSPGGGGGAGPSRWSLRSPAGKRPGSGGWGWGTARASASAASAHTAPTDKNAPSRSRWRSAVPPLPPSASGRFARSRASSRSSLASLAPLSPPRALPPASTAAAADDDAAAAAASSRYGFDPSFGGKLDLGRFRLGGTKSPPRGGKPPPRRPAAPAASALAPPPPAPASPAPARHHPVVVPVVPRVEAVAATPPPRRSALASVVRTTFSLVRFIVGAPVAAVGASTAAAGATMGASTVAVGATARAVGAAARVAFKAAAVAAIGAGAGLAGHAAADRLTAVRSAPPVITRRPKPRARRPPRTLPSERPLPPVFPSERPPPMVSGRG